MKRTETRLQIRAEMDVTSAILQSGRVASEAGFDDSTTCMISTAVSELARNILKYAGEGHIILAILEDGIRKGVEIVSTDEGPGIEDVDAAMQDHSSTGGSLGLGLPGVRRLMDEFDLVSTPGAGTRVTIRKWR